MKEFLTFSDLELEFLGALGLYPVGNFFQNLETGQAYKCIGGNYTPIKEFGSNDASFYTYEFKGKEGTIIFVRADYAVDDSIPSVMVKFNRGISVYLGSSYQNDPHRSISDDVTDEEKNIMSDIKNITIQTLNPRGNKHNYIIRFRPEAADILSKTYFLDGLTTLGVLEGGLSTICCPKEYGDYTVGLNEYHDAMKNEINNVFHDPQIRDLFIGLIPVFERAYKATLYIPAIFENKYHIRYQREKTSTELHYSGIINGYEEEKKKALENIKANEEDFERIVKNYPLEKGKQK